MKSKNLLCLLWCAVLLCGAAAALADTATVQVTSGYLNLRKEPSDGAEILGRFLDGTKLDVKREELGGYLPVMSGEHCIGYVAGRYLKFEQEDAIARIRSPKRYRVKEDTVLRDDCKWEAKVIGHVKEGEEVWGTDTAEWYIHRIEGGFINKFYLEEMEQEERRE